jgi:hypothetical protein
VTIEKLDPMETEVVDPSIHSSSLVFFLTRKLLAVACMHLILLPLHKGKREFSRTILVKRYSYGTPVFDGLRVSTDGETDVWPHASGPGDSGPVNELLRRTLK